MVLDLNLPDPGSDRDTWGALVNAAFQEIQDAINAGGTVGPAAWTPPAAYASGITYSGGPPASVVTYLGETYVFISSTPRTGVAPDSDASVWQKVAAKGASGANVLDRVALASTTAGSLTSGYNPVGGMGPVTPATTSPIELVIEGVIRYTWAGTTGIIVPRFEILDDLGALVAAVSTSDGPGVAASNLLRNVTFSIPVTPASSARTYQLLTSTATAPAGASWSMIGTDVQPGGPFTLKARLA